MDNLSDNSDEPVSAESKEIQSIKFAGVSNMITIINKSLQDKIKESKSWRQTKPWFAVVNVGLVEAKNLPKKQDDSLPDPFVRFKLGNETSRSKVKSRTQQPYWCEQFDLYMYEDQNSMLEITVKSDERGPKELLLGECSIDVNLLQEGTTHNLELPLGSDKGTISLLLTLSHVVETKKAIRTKNEAKNSFALWRTLADLSKVGWLQVVVIGAEKLASRDVAGTCDPFCIVEMDNNRVQTHTLYNTVDPQWNKAISMIMRDIHSILYLSVYDENKHKKPLFLGKVAIPILRLKSKEIAWYQLKDQNLREMRYGIISITAEYVYNPIRAAIRTFKPKEKIFMKPEAKLKIATMKNNIDRTQKLAKLFIDNIKDIQSCISWKAKTKSFTVLVIYIVFILFVELYMVPIGLLLILLKTLAVNNLQENARDTDTITLVSEEDDDLESKEEKKSFMEKFQAIQEVCLTVQEVLDECVCLFERIRNLFRWKNPWITSLVFLILIFLTVVFYMVPLRILLLMAGLKYFFTKLIFPDRIDNNELMDLLSRVYSDKELLHYQEFPVDINIQQTIKARLNGGSWTSLIH